MPHSSGLDAGLVEIEPVGIRLAADRPQHAIGRAETAAMVRVQDEAGGGFFQRPRQHQRFDGNAVLLHGRDQLGAQHRVEAAHHAFLAHQHLGLAAEAVEHARELDGDIAAADDQHTSRPLFELEKAIRGDAELGTGQIGHAGSAAGSNDDALGAVLGVADRNAYGRRRSVRCRAR